MTNKTLDISRLTQVSRSLARARARYDRMKMAYTSCLQPVIRLWIIVHVQISSSYQEDAFFEMLRIQTETERKERKTNIVEEIILCISLVNACRRLVLMHYNLIILITFFFFFCCCCCCVLSCLARQCEWMKMVIHCLAQRRRHVSLVE